MEGPDFLLYGINLIKNPIFERTKLSSTDEVNYENKLQCSLYYNVKDAKNQKIWKKAIFDNSFCAWSSKKIRNKESYISIKKMDGNKQVIRHILVDASTPYKLFHHVILSLKHLTDDKHLQHVPRNENILFYDSSNVLSCIHLKKNANYAIDLSEKTNFSKKLQGQMSQSLPIILKLEEFSMQM